MGRADIKTAMDLQRLRQDTPVSMRSYALNSRLGLWSLLTILVLNDEPVYAEWTKVIRDKEETLTVYIDSDITSPKENLVKVLTLFDHKTLQKAGNTSWLSSQGQWQFDCLKENGRVLWAMYFSGHMGQGNVVYKSSEETKWGPVVPKSMTQNMWELMCRTVTASSGSSPPNGGIGIHFGPP